MMLKLKITIVLFFILTSVFSQRIEKVFLDEIDSTRNFYTVIHPQNTSISGYIFIIPGFGQTAEMTLEQTDFPIRTAESGLLTIIPTLQDGVLSFGVDKASQQSLDQLIEHARSKYELANLPFFIGGFSIGGSCAIKYAQNVKEKPLAVFGIDPPLDFLRFYNASKRDIRLSIDKEPSQESVYMVERIEKEFQGTPETALANFYEISPYSLNDTSQVAVKKFGNIPLRIYTEPDVDWWLKERSFDISNTNILDCSGMINELIRLGNTNAALIVTQNKGYRKPYDIRHPHSWSIVDVDDLIFWLLKQGKVEN